MKDFNAYTVNIVKKSGKYTFEINKDNRCILRSAKVSSVIPFIKPYYKYALDAIDDSKKLIEAKYHLIASMEDLTDNVVQEVSAEESITNHYLGIYKTLEEMAEGSEGDKKDSAIADAYIKKVIMELEAVVEQIESEGDKVKLGMLIEKFDGLSQKYFPEKRKHKTACVTQKPDISLRDETVNGYAREACLALRDFHHGIAFKIKDGDVFSYIEVLDIDDGKPILKIRVNESLNVDAIYPCGDIAVIYPLHTCEFYQKYWKPIVEGIGHFYLSDFSVILTGVMPDIPNKPSDFHLNGFGSKSNAPESITLSFRGENMIWIFEPSMKRSASSKYNEQDYLNSIVECVDTSLNTLSGRKGVAVDILPHSDYVEVDVDFGRGLGVVRLLESQIKIIENKL